MPCNVEKYRVEGIGADHMGAWGARATPGKYYGGLSPQKIFSKEAVKVSFCFFVKPKNWTDINIDTLLFIYTYFQVRNLF